MSIASEIQRIQNGVNNLKTALTNAGYTIPNGTKIDGFAAIVENGGGGGGELPLNTFTLLHNTIGGCCVIFPDEESGGIKTKMETASGTYSTVGSEIVCIVNPMLVLDMSVQNASITKEQAFGSYTIYSIRVEGSSTGDPVINISGLMGGGA